LKVIALCLQVCGAANISTYVDLRVNTYIPTPALGASGRNEEDCVRKMNILERRGKFI